MPAYSVRRHLYRVAQRLPQWSQLPRLRPKLALLARKHPSAVPAERLVDLSAQAGQYNAQF